MTNDDSPVLRVEHDSTGRRPACTWRHLPGLWRGRNKLRGHLRPTHQHRSPGRGASPWGAAGSLPPCAPAPTTLTFLPSATRSCSSFNSHCLGGKATNTISKLLILSHNIQYKHTCIRYLVAALLMSPHPSVAAREVATGLPVPGARAQGTAHTRHCTTVGGARRAGCCPVPPAAPGHHPRPGPGLPHRVNECLPDTPRAPTIRNAYFTTTTGEHHSKGPCPQETQKEDNR